MSYLPPNELVEDFIAFCHMVKSQDSLQAGRAAAGFLAQLYDSDAVAIFRINSAGNELVLCEAIARGNRPLTPSTNRVPISRQNTSQLHPISHTVLSGQNLELHAPFVGYDLADFTKALKLENPQSIRTLRLIDRKGRLVGVVAIAHQGDHKKPRLSPTVLGLISEVIGMVLGGYTELAEAQDRLENMNEIYAIEAAARQDLQTRMASETSHIIGDGPRVQELRRDISYSAKGKNAILLVGEEGVGRRTVAREIHNLSSRANGPFRVLDMKRLSDANLHPELLGYKRGAIEGVASARRGVLVDASGGTLFLKNFDAASLDAQEFLWQVIETQTIRSLGSETDRQIDVRFIASMTPEIYQNWQNYQILPSLFHKLAVNVVEVPSLADIRDDLRPIIQVEIERLNRAHHRDVTMSEDAILFLTSRDYSGNLVELRSLLERIFFNVGEAEIISAPIIQDLINPQLGIGLSLSDGSSETGLKEQIREYERVLIMSALKEAGGSRALAADKLKLPKRTLAEKCKNFGL